MLVHTYRLMGPRYRLGEYAEAQVHRAWAEGVVLHASSRSAQAPHVELLIKGLPEKGRKLKISTPGGVYELLCGARAVVNITLAGKVIEVHDAVVHRENTDLFLAAYPEFVLRECDWFIMPEHQGEGIYRFLKPRMVNA